MRTTILIALLALSGCVTTAEQAVSYYGPDCETFGFKPGTEAFARCVQQSWQTGVATAVQSAGVMNAIAKPTTCNAYGCR